MKQRYPHGPKTEWQEQAKAISEGRIPTNSADIPMLLEWLQDLNWPGALEIGAHLRTLGDAVLPCLAPVLRSGDNIWIDWVLKALGPAAFGSPAAIQLRPELEEIARRCDPEEAHVMAQAILDRMARR